MVPPMVRARRPNLHARRARSPPLSIPNWIQEKSSRPSRDAGRDKLPMRNSDFKWFTLDLTPALSSEERENSSPLF